MVARWDQDEGPGIRLVLPALVTILIMMGLQIPTPFSSLSRLMPVMPFIFTYYWAIQRPAVVPLPSVFIVALLHDLWGEDLVGVTLILALAMQMMLVPHQEVFRVAPFPLRWGVFGALVGALLTLKWMVSSLVHWEMLNVSNLVFQGIMTFALYPLFNHFYARIDKRMSAR